jgi:hypothetical protein
MAKILPSTANVKQIGWAAVGVVAGVALFNILTQLSGRSVVGKVLDGSIVRRA